jgi:hypothetical protein
MTDSITDNGTAISMGKKRRNNGTATKDSPNPNVDLTRDAIKLIRRIREIVGFIFDSIERLLRYRVRTYE